MYLSMNFFRSDNYSSEFKNDVRAIHSIAEVLKNIFNKLLLVNNINELNHVNKTILKDATFDIKFTFQGVIEFLKVPENRHYLLSSYDAYTLRHKLNNYLQALMQIDALNEKFTKFSAVAELGDIGEIAREFHLWFNTYSDHIVLQRDHDKKIDILNKQIADSQAELHRVNSQRTELIYSKASKRYLESARNYEVIFYIIFVAAVLVTIVSIKHFPYATADIVEYVLYKVLTLSIVVTTGTIFLRKASHLRKLHDQANQTSLELQALPMFLKNVDSSEHSEIYKNLADKYFGKEVDQTQNDKIGDLMQDQLLAGTELIKASAEMIKSVKPSSNSDA